MNPHCKYEVHTYWGRFRLDEGAYQDYLAGKLWITWVPGRVQTAQTAAAELPDRVSKEAKALLERADREGVLAVLRERDPILNVPMPCMERMKTHTIEALPLSVRASNGLHRAGIHTFGRQKEVAESEPGLLGIRNLGMKSVLEIRAAFLGECYHRLLRSEKAEFWQSVCDTF